MANNPGDFKPGNQIWRLAKNPGRKRMYDTPKKLMNKCIEYFEWAEDNPLKEQKVSQFQGEYIKGALLKLRPLTLKGLYLYLGMDHVTWVKYSEREGYVETCQWVQDIIWTQKFEGAAADIFNVAIIARELGLADKQDITSGGEQIKNSWHIHPTTTETSDSDPDKGGDDG